MYDLEIHYLDIGQGDCSIILIKNEDKSIELTLISDCGTKGRATIGGNIEELGEEETAWKVLDRKLTQLDVNKVDIITVSHYDKDHYNGFAFLFESLAKANEKEKKNEEITESEKRIIKLLAGTKLYDCGICFKRKMGEYDHDTNEAVDPGFDRNKNSFGGFDLYSRYQNAIIGTDILRMTERTFVGQPSQYSGNFFPIPHNANEGETIMIQQELWGATNSDDQYESMPIDFKRTIRVEERYKETSQRGRVTNKVRIVEGSEPVLEQAYQVKRLSHHWLLNADLFKEKLNGEIQFICIAANGYVLQPPNEESDDFTSKKAYESGNKNAFSLGFLLKFGAFTHWFGGDLTSDQEDEVITCIKHYSETEKLTVLKASHHGSNESTGEDFLRELQPEAVIISAGPGNQLPGPITINRLKDANSVRNVILTGHDKYKPKNDDILPTNFPNFYSISSEESKFIIAGTTDKPADIKLTISQAESERCEYHIDFFEQNKLFEFRDPRDYIPEDEDMASLPIEGFDIFRPLHHEDKMNWDYNTGEMFLEMPKKRKAEEPLEYYDTIYGEVLGGNTQLFFGEDSMDESSNN